MRTSERFRVREAGFAAVVLVLLAGCGDAGPAARVRAGADGVPEMRTLVRTLRGLHVRSERYTIENVVTDKSARSVRVYRSGAIGEAGVSPVRAQVRTSSGEREIRINSSDYLSSPGLASCDGGRAWMRRERGVRAASFPYHSPPAGRSLGGSGPYAGLIDLLETAQGRLERVGAASVDGRPTIELEATVDPAVLIHGISPSKLTEVTNENVVISQLGLRSVPTRLDIFLSAAGLPLRVVTRARLQLSYTETVEVRAVNVPVDVSPPPPSQTIGEAEFARISGFSSYGFPARGGAQPCVVGDRAPIGG
jgi:hypothetical protein